MLATGRRTAASWFRCAGVKDDWDRFYDLLSAIGREATLVMLPLLRFILTKFDPGEGGYWTLAVDDSPTKRFGPQVQAANIHHNPTPGPADGEWLYGHNWVCLAMLLSHPLFGVMVERHCHTFLATSHIVGGMVRVVMLKHPDGNWAAYFSTDVTMSVEAILKVVSDRWAIEELFHDVKEIWGAGKQQVRNVWSSIGCWNLCGWLYALVELECWDQDAKQ